MRAPQPETTVLLHQLLDPEPAAAAQARRLIETTCRGRVADLDEVVLAVDELVTNAVVHGLPQPIHLWVCRADDQLWIEVDNASRPWPGLNLILRPSDDMPCGRGLLIAMNLSTALRVHVGTHRTVISASFATKF
ncbi:ATP-binding protein [Yinghuangia sp. ASG 101]|uniref:ATP-binding protein n=1 Tax=Yinghuangia sp. ASG 101 TaxID=2896848 RepID=UPI001E4248AB|nr:ATP-binding protein [Yinghuangia sp. ASG 101]UGQ13700.1 ATP-binding protein [Yinghuangia sp. ASG 101]